MLFRLTTIVIRVDKSCLNLSRFFAIETRIFIVSFQSITQPLRLIQTIRVIILFNTF